MHFKIILLKQSKWIFIINNLIVLFLNESFTETILYHITYFRILLFAMKVFNTSNSPSLGLQTLNCYSERSSGWRDRGDWTVKAIQ